MISDELITDSGGVQRTFLAAVAKSIHQPVGTLPDCVSVRLLLDTECDAQEAPKIQLPLSTVPTQIPKMKIQKRKKDINK